MGQQLTLVLALFLLTAVATAGALQLPTTPDMETLSLILDLIPFIGAAVAAAMTSFHLRRANIKRMSVLLAAYSSFAGALVGALGVAHLVAVIAKAMNTSDFVYDFRMYSLLQLGLALVACGFIAAMLATRLAMGQRTAWCTSLVVWSVVLVVNVPLIPLQGFAVLFTVLAALGVLGPLAMRPSTSGQ